MNPCRPNHPLYLSVRGPRPQLGNSGRSDDEPPVTFLRGEGPQGSEHREPRCIQGLNQPTAFFEVAFYQCCLIHRMTPCFPSSHPYIIVSIPVRFSFSSGSPSSIDWRGEPLK